jgi:hypothetical protein
MSERLIPVPGSEYRRVFEQLGYDNTTLAVYGLAEFANTMMNLGLVEEMTVLGNAGEQKCVLNFRNGNDSFPMTVIEIRIASPGIEAPCLEVVCREGDNCAVMTLPEIDTAITCPDPENGGLVTNFFHRTEAEGENRPKVSCLCIRAKDGVVFFSGQTEIVDNY